MNRRLQHSDYVLITGGVGFIGTNLAKTFASAGRRLVILDNFSRPGVESNASFLRDHYGDRITIVQGDCRNSELVTELVGGVGRAKSSTLRLRLP